MCCIFMLFFIPPLVWLFVANSTIKHHYWGICLEQSYIKKF